MKTTKGVRYILTENSSTDLLLEDRKGNLIAEVSYKTFVRDWFEKNLLDELHELNTTQVIRQLEMLFAHYRGLEFSQNGNLKVAKISIENPALVVTFDGRNKELAVCRITGEKILHINERK